MKNPSLLKVALGAMAFSLLLTTPSWAESHANSANYYLTTPDEFRGQLINLDVIAVEPVRWKSPVPDIMFFNAFTWDKKANAHGGPIMVMVPTADAQKFAKKYGTAKRGNEPDKMKGILSLVGRDRPEMKEKPEGKPDEQPATESSDKPDLKKSEMRHPPRHMGGPRMWFVDYEGLCRDIIESHKEEMKQLPDEAPPAEPTPAEGGGGQGPAPRPRPPGR